MTPAVMGGAGIGATLLSGIISGVGAATSATASANSFLYKAGIANLNADISKQNAAWTINSGGIKATNYGLKAGQQIADTVAKQGGSGIQVGTGSHAQVVDTQGDVARYEQGIIRADAAHTAYGYEIDSAKYKAEAGMDVAAASDAGKAGKLGILSSIIGTAGSVASKWTQGNTLGIWGGNSGSPLTDPSGA